MSSAYAGVKARIIEIIKSTEPDEHARGTRGGFKHQPQGVLEDNLVPDRSFSLLGTGGHSELPGMAQHKGRFLINLELVILYKATIEQSSRDTVIFSDAESIISQLLSVSTWDQPTSKIELIGGRDGNRTSIPFEVLPLDNDANLAIFQIPVVYSRGSETNTPTA